MGIGNVNANNAAKGIPYDRNEVSNAMKKETSTMSAEENENGIFIEIVDEEANTVHLLCDYDKDGAMDAYRQEIYDGNRHSKAYDDIDFDGTFDRTIDFQTTDEGLIASFDNNADGQIDDVRFYGNEE